MPQCFCAHFIFVRGDCFARICIRRPAAVVAVQPPMPPHNTQNSAAYAAKNADTAAPRSCRCMPLVRGAI